MALSNISPAPTPTNCTPFSANACPTPFNTCCPFLCAEAQVRFLVCQTTSATFLASCNACPSPTPSASTMKTTHKPHTTKPPKTCETEEQEEEEEEEYESRHIHTKKTTTKNRSTSIQTTTDSFTTSSSCTAFSAPSGACPTPFNSCCAYKCAEAQVPFNVCQPTDNSGQFAVCTKCPTV
jgi:hypothetical protein